MSEQPTTHLATTAHNPSGRFMLALATLQRSFSDQCAHHDHAWDTTSHIPGALDIASCVVHQHVKPPVLLLEASRKAAHAI